MKRRIAISIGVLVLLIMTFCTGTIIRPTSVRWAWIKITSATQWKENNRLGMLLHEGMTKGEVEAVLGKPDRINRSTAMVEWIYIDSTTTDGPLVVEFSSRTTVPDLARVSYVHQDHNTEDFIPNEEHFTIGVRTQ